LAAAQPVVIGVLLRVDIRGWRGAPPLLPDAPINVGEGREGAQSFFYDLSPKAHDLTVADVCNKLGSRLERMLTGERSPFAESTMAVRLSLDIGLAVEPSAESWTSTFPIDFLAVLADAGVELTTTHYPATDEGEPRSEDDL